MREILLVIVLTLGLHAELYKEIKKSCYDGDAENCINLGVLYQLGQDLNQSYEKAKFYYSQACDLNHSAGCVKLGDLYYFGQGMDQNNSKAKLYYNKSCKLNNKDGCSNLKILLEDEELKQKKDELERLKKEQEELIKEAELLDDI